MNPGIVFSSFIDDLPVRLADEEVRAGHPLARRRDEAGDRELAGPLDLRLGEAGRRDDELGAALVVLRRRVVPVGVVRDDLAGERRLRARQVAEHAHLDLHPRHELLDHHLLVVAPGDCDRLLELGLVATFEIPTDEPMFAGFTNTG